MNEQKQMGKWHAVVIENLPEVDSAERQTHIEGRGPLLVQEYLRGLPEFVKRALTPVFTLKPAFDRDMIKEGWRSLEKDHPDKDGEFTYDLVDVSKAEDNGVISGPEFEKRAKAQKDIGGQRHLEDMLRQADKIPVEHRKFCLVATETVWDDSVGRRLVPYLRWRGGRWSLGFHCLGAGFHSGCRLVRPRKYQK